MKRESFVIAQVVISAVRCSDAIYSASEHESEFINDVEETKSIVDMIASGTSPNMIENTISLLLKSYKKAVVNGRSKDPC